MPTPAKPSGLRPQLDPQAELDRINTLIRSAPTILEIIVNLSSRISTLLGCERLTLFAHDTKNNQLFSIFKIGGEDPKEIRIPRDTNSVAGFCALARKTISIKSVYDTGELARIHPKLRFDPRWDRAMGFRTRQVLSVPLIFEKYSLGVLQLINKVEDQPFSQADRQAAEEIAETLALAFYHQNKARRAAAGKRSRFSDLIDRGLLSDQDLEAAVTFALVDDRELSHVLMDRHGISREDVVRSLSEFHGCPSFFFDGRKKMPADVLKRTDYEFWHRFCCAPVERSERILQLAVVDPVDLNLQDTIKSIGLAPRITPMVALEDDIRDYIDLSYGRPRHDEAEDELARILVELGQETLEEEDEESHDEVEDAEEAPSAVVRLVNKVIADAFKQGASDIHVEPNGGESPLVIRFRRDGECYVYHEIPGSHRNAFVSRIKILADLNISEKRKPQDGKIRFRLPSERVIELRVATVPTTGKNEDVVMRILAANKPLLLEELAMSPRNLEALRKAARTPYGLILCVGPTGSGKTTTLHSVLGHLNEAVRKIWTAEDPVEITQPGLRQVQVNPKVDLTFAACMRSFLRADPDVIMIGEMRDENTASVGIEASLTGHLVLSTLHTNSAPETVTRLLDMGLDPFNFADALLLVLAQRLVRTLCSKCKEAYRPDAGEIDDLRRAYGAGFDDLGISFDEVTLYRSRPQGCRDCDDNGYRGRMALHEVLVGSDAIHRAILRQKSVEEIRDVAAAEGMTTLLQDGIRKIFQGHTDFKQVRSVCVR